VNGNLRRNRPTSEHKHKEYEVKAFHAVEFGIVCLEYRVMEALSDAGPDLGGLSRSHGKKPPPAYSIWPYRKSLT
jgi:hypothetical protein